MLRRQGSSNLKLNHLPIQTIFLLIFSILFFPQLPSFHCFTRTKVLNKQTSLWMKPFPGPHWTIHWPELLSSFFCAFIITSCSLSVPSDWSDKSLLISLQNGKILNLWQVYEIQDIEHFVKHSVLRINIVSRVLNHLSLRLLFSGLKLKYWRAGTLILLPDHFATNLCLYSCLQLGFWNF